MFFSKHSNVAETNIFLLWESFSPLDHISFQAHLRVMLPPFSISHRIECTHHLWLQCTSQLKVQIPSVEVLIFECHQHRHLCREFVGRWTNNAMHKNCSQKIEITPQNKRLEDYKRQVCARRTMWRFHWSNLHFVYITLVNHQTDFAHHGDDQKMSQLFLVLFPQWQGEKKTLTPYTKGAVCTSANPQVFTLWN